MSGLEHYKRAEDLLESVRETAKYLQSLTNAEREETAQATAALTANLLSHAQVHATLALVAATVAPRALGPVTSSGYREFITDDDDAWGEVTA